MLTNLENKSTATIPEPDIAILRTNVATLRSSESALERQLHEAQRDLDAADAAVHDAVLASSKGQVSRDNLTGALLQQSAANTKIVAAVEGLNKTRPELREATELLARAEACLASQQAGTLESEILSELQTFSGEMQAYWRCCKRIQNLRERARAISQQLFTPGVLDALGPSWGEIRSFSVVEDRLRPISKVVLLSEESNAILHGAARARAFSEKADVDRAKQFEAGRTRTKLTETDAFSMTYSDGTFSCRWI